MSFPIYSPGDIAPSAWANDVGGWLNSAFFVSVIGGSVPQNTLTKLTVLSTAYDPRSVVNNPGLGDLTIPSGEVWLITATIALQASVAAGTVTQYVVIGDGGSAIYRQESARVAGGSYAMQTSAVVAGSGNAYFVQCFDGGPGGLIDTARSRINGFRLG